MFAFTAILILLVVFALLCIGVSRLDDNRPYDHELDDVD